MRNLDQSILDRKQGLEPVIIIGIDFLGTGTETYYGEAGYLDEGFGVFPGIINMPELDQAMNVDGSGVAQSITVKLDDTQSNLLTLLGLKDIYLATVNVYQWFKGYPLNLKVKMFEGVIVGPLTWDEGTRTVEIQATTRLSNVQVSFSYDETNTDLLHQSLLGKVWPMPFGTPIHYPALQLQEIPSGLTLMSFGIPDPSIFWQIAKLAYEVQQADAPYQKIIESLVSAKAQTGSQVQQTFNDYYIPRLQAEMRNNDQSLTSQIDVLIEQYAEQAKFFSTKNSILGGYKFPQNTPLICKIGDQLFTCTFLGGNTTITNPNQACPVHIVPFYPPGYPSNDSGPNSNPSSSKYNYSFPNTYTTQDRRTTITVPQIGQVNGVHTGTVPIPGGSSFTQGGTAIPNWGLTYPVVKQGFTWVSAGSNLTLIDDFTFDFLVSFIPGTLVNVYAYKSYNGTRQLTQVPERYYEIITQDSLTYIRMKRPLSIITYLINLKVTESEDYLNQTASDFSGFVAAHTVDNTDWEDQIYCTFQSSIGPNIVDILIWLITYYTPYTYDLDSFNQVREDVADYPANFVVTDRPLVDDLMNDICYQSRCSLILKDGMYFLKYLSAFPYAYEQITFDDIEEKSLQITTTPVESLITRYTATWRTDYSPDYDTPNKIILKNNVGKYGLVDGGHDFFIYNQFYLVQKSAYFWLLRTSNVFKILKMNVFLNKLNLEVGDAALIAFTKPIFANQEVICEITEIGYNVTDYTISMTFNTWVKLGQMQPYLFAFPGSLDETDYFFPADTITSGAAIGYSPGNIPPPVPFNNLAKFDQTIDYSNWPEDPGDTLGYNQSMKAWADSANAAINASADSRAQKSLDDIASSGSGGNEVGADGRVANFYGNAPVHVADAGNPSNSGNQLNTNIPYFNAETPNSNPGLSPDFSVPPTDKPVVPSSGSGSAGGGVPGQIISGSGSQFTVSAYFNGLPSNDGEDTTDRSPTTVTCIEVHDDDSLQLDSGTWVTVYSVGNAYYIVQPSWAH